MTISEVLEPTAILDDLAGSTVEEALREICRPLAERTNVEAQRLVDALLAGERIGSTAIGDGVAIPHARVRGIHRLVAGLGRSGVGIDFKAPDSSSVTLLFVLLAPARGQSAYVETLARASRLLKSAQFRQSLLKARGADEIRRVFAAEDTG